MELNFEKLKEVKKLTSDSKQFFKEFKKLNEDEKTYLIGAITNDEYDYRAEEKEDEDINSQILFLLRDKKLRPYIETVFQLLREDNVKLFEIIDQI